MKNLLLTIALTVAACAPAYASKEMCTRFAMSVETVATFRDKGVPLNDVMKATDDPGVRQMVANIYRYGWKTPQELAGEAYMHCLKVTGVQI